MKRPPLDQLQKRFKSYIDDDCSGGCQMWHGPRNQKGYARYEYGRGKYLSANWVAFVLELCENPTIQEIVEIRDFCRDRGLTLDHFECNNRCCVHPDHLELVPHRVNVNRGQRGWRSHCPKGHELTDDNVYVRIDKSGRMQRVCRTCRDAYSKAYRAAAKEVVG